MVRRSGSTDGSNGKDDSDTTYATQKPIDLSTQRPNRPADAGRRTGLNRDDEAGLIVKSGGKMSPDQTLYRSALDLDTSITDRDYLSALGSESTGLITPSGTSGLSVYVHLPFCPSRCLTCDHQTSVSHDHQQIDRYLDALEREMAMVSERLGQRHRLQQLHLGGGTPNYLSEVQLVRLMDIVDRHFSIDADTDTSLEANAHRASLSQLTLLHGLGFRGLNLEVRDLDPAVQQALGRHQSLRVVRDVVDTARDIGFNAVSTDLVYGLPQQTAASVRKTVEQLLSLSPDRVACYTYSRRPDKFQHQRAVDTAQMPSLADKVGIFARIVDGFCDADYDWIGLDCFARKDDHIAKAHRDGALHRNWIGYTAQTGRNMIGFGSSSVSDLSSICVQNHPSIEQWRGALEHGRLPIRSGELLTPKVRARRYALSDLMCNLRINDDQHLLRDDEQSNSALQSLREDGLVEINGNSVEITDTGRYSLHQLWGDASPSYRWGQLF